MQLLRLASFLPSGRMSLLPSASLPFVAGQELTVGHLGSCGQNSLLLINFTGQARRLGIPSEGEGWIVCQGIIKGLRNLYWYYLSFRGRYVFEGLILVPDFL